MSTSRIERVLFAFGGFICHCESFTGRIRLKGDVAIWEAGGTIPPPEFRSKYGMTGFVIASPSDCVYPIHSLAANVILRSPSMKDG